MTEKEFFEYNLAKNMPKFNIGQGMGYKSDNWEDYDWSHITITDIVYIPECAYEADGTVKRENAYSKLDIYKIVDDWKNKNGFAGADQASVEYVAYFLWEMLEWQTPADILEKHGFIRQD